jgi:hypothetical protein
MDIIPEKRPTYYDDAYGGRGSVSTPMQVNPYPPCPIFAFKFTFFQNFLPTLFKATLPMQAQRGNHSFRNHQSRPESYRDDVIPSRASNDTGTYHDDIPETEWDGIGTNPIHNNPRAVTAPTAPQIDYLDDL